MIRSTGTRKMEGPKKSLVACWAVAGLAEVRRGEGRACLVGIGAQRSEEGDARRGGRGHGAGRWGEAALRSLVPGGQ